MEDFESLSEKLARVTNECELLREENSVFKACHQIVSVPEDNDDREVRISFGK